MKRYKAYIMRMGTYEFEVGEGETLKDKIEVIPEDENDIDWLPDEISHIVDAETLDEITDFETGT